MARKLSYIIMIILLGLTLSLVFRYKQVDRFIKYNFSSDMAIILSELSNTSKNILANETDKEYSKDELMDQIKGAVETLFYVEKGIDKYKLLNEHFDVRVYSASDILFHFETMLLQGDDIGAYEEEVLIEVIALNEAYSKIGETASYIDDGHVFTQMEMPQDVKMYLEKLDDLSNKLEKEGL